ncbi:MAG TPA: ATP12 family protein [Geminicoccaceae bacterium]
MKRFWREVQVTPRDAGHQVELDRRPLRTPGRRPLVTPSAALAEAIAAEWRGQGEEVLPRTMPLTRLASTAVDRMPDLRAAARGELMAFAGTDLVCYRAAHPPDLVRRQDEVWTPVLAWLEQRFGAPLRVAAAIAPVDQPDASLERLRRRVEALDDWALVGLHALVQPLGSFALGLAVLEGRLDAEAALQASLLDELFEIERWGWDVEIDRRHQALRAEVSAAAAFLAALRPDG